MAPPSVVQCGRGGSRHGLTGRRKRFIDLRGAFVEYIGTYSYFGPASLDGDGCSPFAVVIAGHKRSLDGMFTHLTVILL